MIHFRGVVFACLDFCVIVGVTASSCFSIFVGNEKRPGILTFNGLEKHCANSCIFVSAMRAGWIIVCCTCFFTLHPIFFFNFTQCIQFFYLVAYVDEVMGGALVPTNYFAVAAVAVDAADADVVNNATTACVDVVLAT